MTAISWTGSATGGSWNVASNWNPAQIPTHSDNVTISASGSPITVTIDANATAASLALISDVGGDATTVQLDGFNLTVSGAIALAAQTFIDGAGLLSSSGISGAGAIAAGTTASGGTLEILGSVASGVALSINSFAVTTLKLDGAVTASTPISMTTANQTLEIGKTANVTIVGAQSVTGGTIAMDGGTLTDTSGLTIGAAAFLTGSGLISATTSLNASGLITASGGTLDIRGALSGNSLLDIASSATMKLETTSSANSVIFLSSSGTLEIGASGSLTLATALDGSANTITLDGGTITDALGVTLGANALMKGGGTVDAAVTGTGTGIINANNGDLTISGAVTNVATLSVGTSSTDALTLDGATNSAASVSFNASGEGMLDLGVGASLAVANGISTGTNTIAINGGTLTDANGLTINLNGALTGYGVIGPTTVVNGAGMVTATGGTLDFQGTVDSGSTTNFDVSSGAKLQFDGAVGSGATFVPTVTFNGNSGAVDLTNESSLANFDGKIAGFQAGDTVNLGAGFVGDTVVLNADGHTLDILSGSMQVATIDLVGAYTGANFAIDGNGDLTTNATCFMAGTRIATPDGEFAVETLKRGDVVFTADGRAMPIAWLGVQTISATFADPNRVWPIRVKAGALADTVPSRDLLLSPDHALLVDGALIQAGALVNGTSITRELRVPKTFVYYHVELADHALILAEGAPAETFVDNVDRLGFDNWAEHRALYPEGKEIEELPHPRAKALRQIPVDIRVKLAERGLLIAANKAAAA